MLENKSIEKDIKNTPYSTQTQIQKFGEDVLGLIKKSDYKFSDDVIKAIDEWLKYKFERNESLSIQQVTFLLKQLNNYQLAKHDIVYLIENSIARGYKGIMEPTKNSISTNNAKPLSKYSSSEYIIPETHEQKIILRNYLERCYMRELLDPRNKQPLSVEQKSLIGMHLKNARKECLSITDYIYHHEVTTGICLLDMQVA